MLLISFKMLDTAYYHCGSCVDVDFCTDCYDSWKHPHSMSPAYSRPELQLPGIDERLFEWKISSPSTHGLVLRRKPQEKEEEGEQEGDKGRGFELPHPESIMESLPGLCWCRVKDEKVG
jgi:hypothetical protein